MASGLMSVRWPARLQHLHAGALAAHLPAGWELWLDGGHNPAAAVAVEEFVRGWDARPLHMVLGMLSNRDPVEFLRPLAPHLSTMQTVAIPGVDSTASALACAEAARTLGIAANPADGVAQAIDAIVRSKNGPARILIGGSLYLAGHVLGLNHA